MLKKLNTDWHKQGLWILFIISVAHLVEHFFQMFQIWALGWEPHDAGGLLGWFYPWLMESEVLHYAFAFIMLVGLIILRPGFRDKSRVWWDTAIIIQIWHHFEHLLLISQALMGENLWGSPVPISILQLFFPRAELHFVYNMIVFVPMCIAMYIHRHNAVSCSCATFGKENKIRILFPFCWE